VAAVGDQPHCETENGRVLGACAACRHLAFCADLPLLEVKLEHGDLWC